MKQTPLHSAAKSGNDVICSTLLLHGADATLRDSNNKNPFTVALESGHATCVRLFIIKRLVSSDHLTKGLFVASEYGYASIVKMLIEAGADVTVHDIVDRRLYIKPHKTVIMRLRRS